LKTGVLVDPRTPLLGHLCRAGLGLTAGQIAQPGFQLHALLGGHFLEHDAHLGQLQRDNFRKAVKAGVKMSFGTDAGVCSYDKSVRQFAMMVQYGMTPMQAIQAATSNAADLLGHSDLVGSIKPGKYADVIAVSGDPLQDVSLLEHVQFVMKDGKVYKQ